MQQIIRRSKIKVKTDRSTDLVTQSPRKNYPSAPVNNENHQNSGGQMLKKIETLMSKSPKLRKQHSYLNNNYLKSSINKSEKNEAINLFKLPLRYNYILNY